jgi:hypothetical protein
MCGHAKGWLNSRFLCLVTWPLAALLASGIGGGVFGAWGGVVYGALHGSLSFVIEGGLRGALAGTVAGFIAGLMSGLDRITWPESMQMERDLQARGFGKNGCDGIAALNKSPVNFRSLRDFGSLQAAESRTAI